MKGLEFAPGPHALHLPGHLQGWIVGLTLQHSQAEAWGWLLVSITGEVPRVKWGVKRNTPEGLPQPPRPLLALCLYRNILPLPSSGPSRSTFWGILSSPGWAGPASPLIPWVTAGATRPCHLLSGSGPGIPSVHVQGQRRCLGLRPISTLGQAVPKINPYSTHNRIFPITCAPNPDSEPHVAKNYKLKDTQTFGAHPCPFPEWSSRGPSLRPPPCPATFL